MIFKTVVFCCALGKYLTVGFTSKRANIMDFIIYSPISKMDISTFNEKALHAMKYHQLLKLSHKYNVKKRWAKKEDLIKSLLAVQTNLHKNTEIQDNTVNEELEWTDGSELFKDVKPISTENKNLGRSTFTVENHNLNDSRATYNVAQSINDILPDYKFNLADSRGTFDIPKNKLKPNKVARDSTTQKPRVKMLTVPSSTRVLSRGPINKVASIKESPLKLSSRSITIKKTKDTMSPLKTARSLLFDNKSSVSRQSLPKLSASQRGTSERLSKPKNDGALNSSLFPKSGTRKILKENIELTSGRQSVGRRKSKSDDSAIRRRSGRLSADTATFHTPPAASIRSNPAPSKTINGLNGATRIKANKMPDFAVIHERQFSKMDSLDEYINKKSDRVKKLFGTPTLSRQTEKIMKPVNCLHGLPMETSIKENLPLKPAASKTNLATARNIISRNPQLRTQTDVKDKNRSHIHGIRTNRRFELQMKFRNI